MTDATGLGIALAHAALGRDVFPFRLAKVGAKWTKTPLVAWKTAASHDEAEVRAMFAKHPGAACGWRLPEGLIVADVDDAAAFAATGLALPETARQGTPSGGEHRLYLGDGRQTVKEVPGLDTRAGTKGFVGLYAVDSFAGGAVPAPGWLLEGARTTERAGKVAQALGTRAEIASFLGGLSRLGADGEDLVAVVDSRLRRDLIVDLDEGRPWLQSELHAMARDFGRKDGEPDTAWTINRKAKADDALEPILLMSLERDEAEPLVLGRLDGHDNTVLFGDGGVGKGVYAAWLAARLTNLGAVVLVLDWEAHTRYEWRPRFEDFGGDGRMAYVLQPSPRAIWDVAEELGRRVAALREEHGGARVWVVVDSVTYACVGEEVEKSATAARYWASVQAIGAPTLSLAHVTKADADPKHPFGSVQWSNGARVTWGMSADGEEPDSPRVLRNRKTNQRMAEPPVQVEWSWVNGGRVPATLEEGPRGAGKVADRLYDAMLGEDWTTSADALALVLEDGQGDATPEAVRQALRRDSRFEADRDGRGVRKLWRVVPPIPRKAVTT